jgi:hypothetical protein
MAWAWSFCIQEVAKAFSFGHQTALLKPVSRGSKRWRQCRRKIPAKGLSQLPSPPQSSAPADGEVTDLTYILGFLLLLGLGAMLIVVAWR